MGTVQENAVPTGPLQDPGPPEGQDFSRIPAKVDRVIVDGLTRTHDDIVMNQVKPLFAAENFRDMVTFSHDIKTKLERLGLFKSIEVTIDTSKEKSPCCCNYGYEIYFDVKEFRPVSGGVNTLIGNNDASLLFGLRFPNIFGRGERVNVEYTHGTKQTRGYNVNFAKPLCSNPDLLFNVSAFQYHSEYPWSSYRETDQGVSADLTFPTHFGIHCLKWEGVLRDLRALSRMTSFAVREQSGHTFKSSLKHMFVRDMRDDPILPNVGSLYRLVSEFAGLGGNVEFIKQDFEIQLNKPIAYDSVVQLSLAGGVMKSTDVKKEVLINDRFFLGGPLTLRGFNQKGVGPHSDGNALGGDAYWLCGLHLYTPLPFRPGKGGFGDLFRTHLFVNAGNIANICHGCTMSHNLSRLQMDYRLSMGAGVVLRMGKVARMELNYVFPIRMQRGDSVNPGLQFGIGLSFL